MKSVVATVLLLSIIGAVSYVNAICISNVAYHQAAKALGYGMGNVSTSSVCRYGNVQGLNTQCPTLCSSLITATWGDCYCKEPNYKPGNVSNDLINQLTVQQYFLFFAYPQSFGFNYQINCNAYMLQPSSMKKWQCTN